MRGDEKGVLLFVRTVNPYIITSLEKLGIEYNNGDSFEDKMENIISYLNNVLVLKYFEGFPEDLVFERSKFLYDEEKVIEGMEYLIS